MRRVAVMDIGTHSILYLLAEKKNDSRIVCVSHQIESTRLGGKLDASGRIADAPLQKAVEVIRRYRTLAESQQAEKTVAVGTHLFRAAQNRDEAVCAILKNCGIAVEILSEAAEAEWSHCGALYGRSMAGPVVTADIGGGSTETVLGLNGLIQKSSSVPLGAVSLTERFFPLDPKDFNPGDHDPPADVKLSELESFVAETVESRFGSLLSKGKHLVAVGGTATTLAALDLGLQRYDPEMVDGHVLTEASVIRRLKALAGVNLTERKKQLALDPKRADIIVAGTVILKAIMKAGSFRKVLVSDRGLRFGIALREFKSSMSWK